MTIPVPPAAPESPSPSSDPAPPAASRRILSAVLLAVIALVALGAVAGAFYFLRGTAVPGDALRLSGLTTARGLEQGQVAGEGRIFDVGERVVLIFGLENGQEGRSVAARVVSEGGAPIEVPELSYAVQGGDTGLRSVGFTPTAAGSYSATLLLDGQPIATEPVSFKVVAGGSQLQEVQTAKAVDENYRPTEISNSFAGGDTVYIAYRAVGAAPGDTLQVRYYIDGELQPSNPRDQDQFTEAGTFRGYFSIQGQPNSGLRAGNYRAELYYNQELVAVVNFTVQ